MTLTSEVQQSDPQPEPPASFLQPRRVQRLVQQMKGLSTDTPQEEREQAEASTLDEQPAAPPERRGAPTKLVRTGVASMAEGRAFGPMMAAEAQARGF